MNRRIKILFLAANPIDSDRLRLDEEIRQIDQALRQSEFRDRFEIRQHWAVRVSELQNILLRHKPDIVHFSGHGSEASEIYLEDEHGESYAVPGQALGELFRVLRGNIKCVVLNACFSQTQARAIAKAVDCVIGMSQAIGDVSSIRFAAAFYQALAFGKDVRTAFELGKNQIDLEKLPDSETPRLFNPKVTSASELPPPASFRLGQSYPNPVHAGAQLHFRFDVDAARQLPLRLQIFDRNQGNIQRAGAELAAARQEVRRVEMNLQQRLAAAFNNYANARQQVQQYENDILPDARESLELIQQGYRQGEFGYLELLTSQRTFFRVNLDYVTALRDLWVNITRIEGLLLSGGLQSPPQ